MYKIRLAVSGDLDALYRICLKTGHSGGDASHLYSDAKLLGEIYAAPYLLFSPDLAVVVEKDGEVLGYCVGTADTKKFEAQLEADWWPTLRQKYQNPDVKKQSTWSADEHGHRLIHRPDTIPKQVVDQFPAHIHMNLLPELQGGGIGTKLLDYWIHTAVSRGVTAVHIGASSMNERAVQFWKKQGFKRLEGNPESSISETIWMGRHVF